MIRLYGAWKATYLSLIEDRSLPASLQWTVLALILIGCLAVRLITIDVPPLDRTMWKEIDYIEISKNYVKNEFNFFKPEITWPAEPPRVTAMELPLIPFAAAILYKLFGFNVYTVRLIPLISWLGIIVAVFLLSKREFNETVALLSALVAGILPIFHEFRNILFTEPTMILFSVLTLYFYAQWTELKKAKYWILAFVTFTLAIALKLTPLYLLLPLSYVAIRENKYDKKRYREFVFFVCLSLFIPIAWYSYAYYLTKVSIDVFGIFGGHDKMQTFTMLSKPSWYIIMSKRVIFEILGGPIGAVTLITGVFSLFVNKKGGLIFAYLLAISRLFYNCRRRPG